MFDGLKTLSAAIELLAWVSVAAGLYVIVMAFGERSPELGYLAGGGIIGSALLVILLAHVARAVAFIAEAAAEQRDALPAPGGGQAPGWLDDVRYDRELRRLSRGRYWVDGHVFSDLTAARKALTQRADPSE